MLGPDDFEFVSGLVFLAAWDALSVLWPNDFILVSHLSPTCLPVVSHLSPSCLPVSSGCSQCSGRMI